MPHPGSYKGAREAWLTGELDAYRAAVVINAGPDVLLDIQRRFFKRFPVDLPDTTEPTAEWLAEVNDNEADPEPQAPDEGNLTAEEYSVALKEWDERHAKIKKTKEVSTFQLGQDDTRFTRSLLPLVLVFSFFG